jgi:type IV pilus assembly protein PilW
MNIQSTSPIMNLLPQASPQRGFSLIELMISITLGLILLLGVLQLLDSTRQANRTNDALGQLQENGRIALELISKDIREAGNGGCNRTGQLQIAGLPVAITTPYGNPPRPIQGLAAGTLANMVNTATAPTEGLFLSGLATGSTSLAASMATQNSPISFRAGGSWRTNDLLILSDCLLNGTLADAFVALADNTGVAGVIASPRRLQVRYPEFAILGSAFARQLYIGDIDGDGVRSLYRTDLTNATTAPLVDGVVDMRFRFGMDTNADGQVDVYVGMVPAPNWDNVLSVEISLLLRDTTPTAAWVATAPQTYTFPSWAAGTTTAPVGDTHLYTVMGTTIALRNRTQ